MINSRSLYDLHPPVAQRAAAFKEACAEAGIDVLITSTFRDSESQDALYAQGRTAPGAIVTNARGGDSYHNWKCAFDFVPITNGKPMWNDLDTIRKCGAIGEKCGLEWAGRWHTFKEMLHFQYTGGLTLTELKAGKIPK